MVSMETAEKWYAAIQEDPWLTKWMSEAEKVYVLNIAPTSDKLWFSRVGSDKAIIGMADTKRPLPCFAHEILHVCLSARGYKHIVEAGNTDPIKLKLLQALLSALDNELQHHRMFEEFVAAGFQATEFFHDGDAAGHADVLTDIEALTKNYESAFALLPFLTLIAPGGDWPDGVRESLTQALEDKVSEDTWDRLQDIKGIIGSWKLQQDLDATNTVAAIIETLGDFDFTYVGEPNSYPDGAFIPKGLTQAQFEEHAKAVYEANNG
jgi:hypothetical protein